MLLPYNNIKVVLYYPVTGVPIVAVPETLGSYILVAVTVNSKSLSTSLATFKRPLASMVTPSTGSSVVESTTDQVTA